MEFNVTPWPFKTELDLKHGHSESFIEHFLRRRVERRGLTCLAKLFDTLLELYF
jgi:hypothetical protein